MSFKPSRRSFQFLSNDDNSLSDGFPKATLKYVKRILETDIWWYNTTVWTGNL